MLTGRGRQPTLAEQSLGAKSFVNGFLSRPPAEPLRKDPSGQRSTCQSAGWGKSQATQPHSPSTAAVRHRAHRQRPPGRDDPSALATRPLPISVYTHTERPLNVKFQAASGIPAHPTHCVYHILSTHHTTSVGPLPAMPFVECHLLPEELLRWHLSSPGSEQVQLALACRPDP